MGRSWQEVKAAKQQLDEPQGQTDQPGTSAPGLGTRIAALFADLDEPAFDDLPPRSGRIRAAEFED